MSHEGSRKKSAHLSHSDGSEYSPLDHESTGQTPKLDIGNQLDCLLKDETIMHKIYYKYRICFQANAKFIKQLTVYV